MSDADNADAGEDPGALIEDPARLDEIEPSPKPEPAVPEEDDPKVKDTEGQPT